MRIAPLLVASALIAAASPTLSAQSLKDFSVGISVDTPVGDFASLVTEGFGLSVRTVFGDPATTWSGRGSFGFNYFSGKPGGPYVNIQFLGLGGDLVHRSSANFYQFAGILLPGTKYALRTQTTTQRLIDSRDFGVTGGFGVNFTFKETKLFAELAATSIFTGSTHSSWVPFRAGIKF
jgi:hypothetical protein